MELNELGLRLGRFQKAKQRLIEFKEAYEMFDKVKASKLGAKIAMLNSVIMHYKAEFDGVFGDLQAKTTAFKKDFEGRAVNFRKMTFENSVEYYKGVIKDKLKSSISETGFNVGIDVKNLRQTKRYAFKCAFYFLTNNQNGFIETLGAYERFKNLEKARNAGKLRNSYRVNKSKYSNAENGETQDEQGEFEDGFND